MQFLPGTTVRARGALWEVVYIEPAGEQQRFRLRSMQEGLRGIEIDLLYPFEPIIPLQREFDPARAGRLVSWRLYHQAFLLDQALGTDAFTASQPGRLDLAPYQLVPVMRALQMSRPRLLLADGVGLGKTIQAGLVITELIARRRAHRILVVSPAGPLLNQWNQELKTRFGLRFKVIKDWSTLQEERRGLELGANPFDHVSYCLTSIDFIKQEKVLQDLERTSWDVVIIDEAHHCVRMGAAANPEDSRRRKLAEVLARQCDGLLLLTATPHDGYDPHFASMIELLDPSLLDGKGMLRGEAYQRHVIRRLKRHIKNPATGEQLFKDREVTPVPVIADSQAAPAFVELQHSLLELVIPRLRAALRSGRYGDVLAFISLLKRSVSTVAATASTLKVVHDRYVALVDKGGEVQEIRKERLKTLKDYRQRMQQYGTLQLEEELDQAALEAEDIAAEIFLSTDENIQGEINAANREVRREGDRLRRIGETGEGLASLLRTAQAAAAQDPKLPALLHAITTIRATEPQANILVYTEYTDSQDALVAFLQRAATRGLLLGEVLVISGKDNDAERIRITGRFSEVDNIVLVSTDATAEGLNLHSRCHHLLHLELPYNPNRLEQRNGRIDRYGQKKAPIVSYLYLAGTFEERLLMRLVAKYEKQRAKLKFMPNTLGVELDGSPQATIRLLQGLTEEQGSLFVSPNPIRRIEEEAEDVQTAAYRELLAEVDRAMSGFEQTARTHAWLAEQGLGTEDRLLRAVDAAHKAGKQQSAVDLLQFAESAITMDGGGLTTLSEDIVELSLPTNWTYGLDDIPGYNASRRSLKLTTNRTVTHDQEGSMLGFLGRAHPLVRRAIDRVRNTHMGAAEGPLDQRVSVARAPGHEPEILFTFLGTVKNRSGRAFERLFGVRVSRSGHPAVLIDAPEWQALAAEALPTAGVWERHFADWGWAQREAAAAAGEAAFAPLGKAFQEQMGKEIEFERRGLDLWLAARAKELCGGVAALQMDLLGEGQSDQPAWKTLTDPLDRLVAFASDGKNSVALRREAEGVVKLYRDRCNDLEVRSCQEIAEPTLVGMLLLVPAEGGR